MKHIHTFEGFLNEENMSLDEGLQDTKFSEETANKIWNAIKAVCESSTETTSYDGMTLNKLSNSNSEKWEFVSKNADKLRIGQISATASSLLVMVVEGATVKAYFEIAPFDTLKQKFKADKTVYVSVVTNDNLSMGRIRAHKKIVYNS